MANGKKYNVVQDRETKKYYVCQNSRPNGCDWFSYNKIKKLDLKFIEDPSIYNLFSNCYKSVFRGFIPIEMYKESDRMFVDMHNKNNSTKKTATSFFTDDALIDKLIKEVEEDDTVIPKMKPGEKLDDYDKRIRIAIRENNSQKKKNKK
jgi:hypothetical protein